MRFRLNRDQFRRYYVGFACLLIFLFVLQAKLEVYGHRSHRRVHHPCASTKLCIDASASKALVPAIVTHSFAAAQSTYSVLLQGEPLEVRVFSSLISHNSNLSYQRRFLRPPPAA